MNKRIGAVRDLVWSNDTTSDYWHDLETDANEILENLKQETSRDYDKYDIYTTACEYADLDFEALRQANTDDLGDIIAIGDLGRWNGRAQGYKIAGRSIADCLTCEGYGTFFIDACNDLRLTDHHHDGTNYILYRAFRDDLTNEQRENFLNKVYQGRCTRRDITRYTRAIGDLVILPY